MFNNSVLQDNSKVTADKREGTSILKLTDITSQNQGYYQCSGDTKAGQFVAEGLLEVISELTYVNIHHV